MFRYNSNSFLSLFSFLYVDRSSKYLIKIFLMKKTMNTFSLGWCAITHLQIYFRVAVENAGTFLCDRDNTSHFSISNFFSPISTLIKISYYFIHLILSILMTLMRLQKPCSFFFKQWPNLHCHLTRVASEIWTVIT